MSDQQPPADQGQPTSDTPATPAAPEPVPPAPEPVPPAPEPAVPPTGYAPPPTWPPPGVSGPPVPPPGTPALPPPPGLPAEQPAAAYPTAYPQTYAYRPSPPTSSNAIVGLILAVISWVFCPVIPAIVALILARESSKEIERSNGAVDGAGLNTATRIIAWINIGLWAAIIVGFGLLFLVFGVIAAVSSGTPA